MYTKTISFRFMSNQVYAFCASSSSYAECTGLQALLGSDSCSHVFFFCVYSHACVYSHVFLFCVQCDHPLSFVYISPVLYECVELKTSWSSYKVLKNSKECTHLLRYFIQHTVMKSSTSISRAIEEIRNAYLVVCTQTHSPTPIDQTRLCMVWG